MTIKSTCLEGYVPTSKLTFSNLLFLVQNDTNSSLSLRANSYEQIYKEKFYFTYVILKIIFLEILFFPVTVKRYFKN